MIPTYLAISRICASVNSSEDILVGVRTMLPHGSTVLTTEFGVVSKFNSTLNVPGVINFSFTLMNELPLHAHTNNQNMRLSFYPQYFLQQQKFRQNKNL